MENDIRRKLLIFFVSENILNNILVKKYYRNFTSLNLYEFVRDIHSTDTNDINQARDIYLLFNFNNFFF